MQSCPSRGMHSLTDMLLRRSNIRMLASIESAMGLLNIREIATADPRIEGLVFAAEDYCADTVCFPKIFIQVSFENIFTTRTLVCASKSGRCRCRLWVTVD